jgi:hypothetical protein
MEEEENNGSTGLRERPVTIQEAFESTRSTYTGYVYRDTGASRREQFEELESETLRNVLADTTVSQPHNQPYYEGWELISNIDPGTDYNIAFPLANDRLDQLMRESSTVAQPIGVNDTSMSHAADSVRYVSPSHSYPKDSYLVDTYTLQRDVDYLRSAIRALVTDTEEMKAYIRRETIKNVTL